MTTCLNPLVFAFSKFLPLKSLSPRNPFDTTLPYKVPSRYWTSPKAHEEQQYALYTLVPLGPNGANDLLSFINLESKAAVGTSTVILPANHDFTSKTLRDIYDYHTNLLDEGTHHIALGKLLVAAHRDWRNNGVLLVEFNCNASATDRIWTLGVTRVPTDMAASCIMLLEDDTDYFNALKVEELETKWADPIDGYTNSDWSLLGHSRHDS